MPDGRKPKNSRECENGLFDERGTDLCSRQQQPFGAQMRFLIENVHLFLHKGRRGEMRAQKSLEKPFEC